MLSLPVVVGATVRRKGGNSNAGAPGDPAHNGPSRRKVESGRLRAGQQRFRRPAKFLFRLGEVLHPIHPGPRGLAVCGHLRRSGHHRHPGRQAGGIPSPDAGLPGRKDRPHPGQIGVQVCPECPGLHQNGAGAEGPGVTVAFEKERINTAVMNNEMFLSMMSAFAQEESISISKNMRKGAVMRMQNGTFRLSQIPYGYRCDQNGKLIICEEEASIVRRVYDSFLQGEGVSQIACQLMKEGVPKRNGNPVWSRYGILYILRNERYMGDERYRKSYRSDEIPFKKIDNRGEKPQFYAENTHEAIVSRETFQKVQWLLQGKSEKFGQEQTAVPYPFSGKLICGECGSILYRRVTARGIRWICSRHLYHSNQCKQKGSAETFVQDKFCLLLHKLSQNREAILAEYLKHLEELKDRDFLVHSDAMELNRQIAILSEQNHALHSLWAKECIDSAFFIAQNNELEQKIARLRKDLQRYRDANDYTGIIEQTKQLLSLVSSPLPDSFDPELFRKTVEQAAVSDKSIVFHLKNGLKLEDPAER